MTPPALRLVCPVCRGELTVSSETLNCAACGAAFPYLNGFPDLTVGARFEDEPDADRSAYEERANEHTARAYLAPAFRRLFPNQSPRVLSVGCGNGIDVDVLAADQFQAAGVDCGNRTAAWPGRRFPERLVLANGMHLPFEDAWFDVAYCGCVFPHVGTVGDSNHVAPDCQELRLKLAREMTRVVKPGGYILVSSPNRWCPVDIFHGRTPAHPLPRLNPPGSRFLLSPADYRQLFGAAGCDWFRLLPVTDYWGFVNRGETRKGRALVWPVQQAFRLAAWEPLRILRGAPFSPWLVMLIRKAR
jgi:SAM-dependent methyltransferase